MRIIGAATKTVFHALPATPAAPTSSPFKPLPIPMISRQKLLRHAGAGKRDERF